MTIEQAWSLYDEHLEHTPVFVHAGFTGGADGARVSHDLDSYGGRQRRNGHGRSQNDSCYDLRFRV